VISILQHADMTGLRRSQLQPLQTSSDQHDTGMGKRTLTSSHQHADSCKRQFICPVSAMRVVFPYTDTSPVSQ